MPGHQAVKYFDSNIHIGDNLGKLLRASTYSSLKNLTNIQIFKLFSVHTGSSNTLKCLIIVYDTIYVLYKALVSFISFMNKISYMMLKP